jgi:soluble lytic murein transglycosylase-like protein
MGRLEDATPSLVKAETLKEPRSEGKTRQGRRNRLSLWWVWPILFLQLVVIAGIVWVFTQAGSRIGSLDQKAQMLTDETTALKREIQQLRQYMASKSNEDIIFLKIMVTKPDVNPDLARQIAQNVSRYCALYGHDPDLVLSIIAVESHFNPRAVSNKGAVGLMQVMPQWKRVLGIADDLKDPEASIKYGLQILGFYLEMYKDRKMALTAYNRGPGPVDMALMRGESPLNGYVPRVMKTYQHLKSMNVGRL